MNNLGVLLLCNQKASLTSHFDLIIMIHRPRAILDIIKSGEDFRISTYTKMPEQGNCERCGYISSQVISSPRLWVLHEYENFFCLLFFQILLFMVVKKEVVVFCYLFVIGKNVQKWCKACVLLEGLNRGLPKLGIGRSRGLNNEQSKNIKQGNETKSIESKQCGTLDF